MKKGEKTLIAAIFDMDGVIADTQLLHSESEVIALAHLGIKRSAVELAERYAGVTDRDMFSELLREHGVSDEHLPELELLKARHLRERLARGVPLVEGIERLIGDLRAYGCALGVASGSPLSLIREVLEHPRLQGCFQVAVSADEVPRGKPAPDVFLEAARRLQVDPSNCVVIEDARSGMVAARGAKMRCIGLVRDLSKQWPADMVVGSLHEISMKAVEELLFNQQL